MRIIAAALSGFGDGRDMAQSWPQVQGGKTRAIAFGSKARALPWTRLGLRPQTPNDGSSLAFDQSIIASKRASLSPSATSTPSTSAQGRMAWRSPSLDDSTHSSCTKPASSHNSITHVPA